MSLSINQNIMAMNSYRNLSATQNGLSKSLEKLSSGFRINRAADDAAGLGISEGLRAQVGGNKQAVRNAQDGISLVQTAEGALNEVHSMLQRMRTLAVQGANDSNSANNRQAINEELQQLTDEIARISHVTEFNGTKLLNNAGKSLHFQVGANADKDLNGSAPGTQNVINVRTADITKVSTALKELVTANPLDPVQGEATFEYTAQSAAGSITVNGVQIDLEANDDATKVAAKIKAAGLGFEDATANGTTITIKGAADGTNGASTVTGAGVANFDVTASPEVATTIKGPGNTASYQKLIETLDAQITSVSRTRGEFGAVQNRFEHTIANLNVAVENLSASESRIRDTDMAEEMMNFTKNQILSQAGTSMLAQANQVPQGVLALLR